MTSVKGNDCKNQEHVLRKTTKCSTWSIFHYYISHTHTDILRSTLQSFSSVFRSSEFLLSGLLSWAQCSVKQLFHVFSGHNFRYWNTKMLNTASLNANSPHLGKKKDFILLFTDYKWQRSHHFHILENPRIYISLFLILQIWDPIILPDIKAFSACDIFIYFTTLFYSWNFHCCWVTRLIMYVHSSHHSVIFYLLFHQNLLKNLFLYLSLLLSLKTWTIDFMYVFSRNHKLRTHYQTEGESGYFAIFMW